MSREAWLAMLVLLSIPILGVVGKFLETRLGSKTYRQQVLPRVQRPFYSLFGHRGGIFAGALDPNQWKTDKKSFFLIFVGLPVGILVLVVVMQLVLTLLS